MANSLQDLLTKVLPSQEDDWKWYLLKNWNIIVGDLSQRIRLEKIQDDTTLIIGVYNSAWIQELYFLSHILIKNINQHLTTPRIKHLRFKYSPPRRLQKKTLTHKVPLSTPVTLTNTEKGALNNVQDNELKHALENFLIRCHRERS